MTTHDTEDKVLSLDQFLTKEEIEEAIRLYESKSIGFAKTICDKVIKPNIERINNSIGQENDPMYLSYAIEYVMMLLTNKTDLGPKYRYLQNIFKNDSI